MDRSFIQRKEYTGGTGPHAAKYVNNDYTKHAYTVATEASIVFIRSYQNI